MFFLLRVAFWLIIVLALLPSGGAQQSAQASAQAAVAIGQRAQAGAKMVYEFFNDHASHGTETGSVSKSKVASNAGPKLAAAVRTIPASLGSQNTLKDGDLDAAWQGPVPVRTERIPLPRKAPHRRA